MCFNKDWRYIFTLANNICPLELSSRRQRNIPLGGRYRQVSLKWEQAVEQIVQSPFILDALTLMWRDWSYCGRWWPQLRWGNFDQDWVNTWWRHQMGTFSALLALCAVTGEFLSQRPVTRWFDFFIYDWTNVWVNNRDAGDLRRYHAHCDVTVM